MLNKEFWILKLLLLLILKLNHIRNIREYKILNPEEIKEHEGEWMLKNECWTTNVEQRMLNVEIAIVIEV